MTECNVCFRHCRIHEGDLGFCKARTCKDGVIEPANYGRATSIALDPIEKKPLNRFHPGEKILSFGSYGCNLRCPFCQNDSISWSNTVLETAKDSKYVSPRELVNLALFYADKEDNCGIAFTYNEPLISYEYIRDCAKLSHQAGLVNVLVTNGTAEIEILEEILPYIDAMNIDLKSFNRDYYEKTLGGNLDMTKAFIERAVKDCHVELTTLIVPDGNDTDDELIEMCEWISGLKNSKGKVIGKDIPLHISRFFPRFFMADKEATDVELIYHLKDVASKYLKYVYTGNC